VAKNSPQFNANRIAENQGLVIDTTTKLY